jgi:hypothetical protein
MKKDTPKKWRTWIIIILVLLIVYLLSLLTGCAPKAKEVIVTKEVEVTRQVEVTKLVIVTATQVPPTETPIPTQTPQPTTVPPTLTPDTKAESIAKNFQLIQEQNGVEIILERVLISDPDSEIGLKHKNNDGFQNKRVYVQPIISIKNNTDKIIQMSFVGDIIIMANDEQISYNNFLNYFYMPEYSKDILPGAIVSGPIWVALSRYEWNQITNLTVRIPHFTSNDNRITDDFMFQIEVHDWGFEPLPEHLKK